MTRRCVIERWVQRKTDQKLIFNGNYSQIVFFVFFFGFRMHFHYVLSYLFGLFGVRSCVSILWHSSLPKNATFAWKNSEKPWFRRFLVIFVFLTWRYLWRHCGVIQGMFVLFLVPMDSGGSQLPTSTTHLMFRQSVSEILGGWNLPPPPGCEMGPKSPALLGLRGNCTHTKIVHVLCTISKFSPLFGKIISILNQIVWATQQRHWNFSRPNRSWSKVVLHYWSKQYFVCFDQELKNCLA